MVRTIGGTTVLSMTGASPGGISILAVLPERDLVFAAYGNESQALTLLDELVDALAGGSSASSFTPATIDL